MGSMNELDEARWAKEVTEAWEKVTQLLREIPPKLSEHSSLFAQLQKAIVNYRVVELNRYNGITKKETS